MKQIIVAQEQVYAAKVGGGAITTLKECNELLTGAIAVFTKSGALVTTVNMATVLDDVKEFYFIVGNQQSGAAEKAKITVPIPRYACDYTKSAYVAPVKLTKFVGSDGTIGSLGLPTFVTGAEFSLKITDTTSGLRTLGATYSQEVFRYSYVGKSSDSNNTSITALIAAINADPNRIVNATVVGSQAGINLTTINTGVTFSISLDGALAGATVEQPEGTVGSSVAINYGIGTSDQVAALEDAYSAERGNTNRTYLNGLFYKNPSLVVSGETYNMYTFDYSTAVNNAMSGPIPTSKMEVVVAVPNGTAVATSFETIMAEIFAGLVATSPAETGA